MFATAYLLYVMPVFILQSLFLGTAVFSTDALVPTLVAFVLLRLYLATSITNKLVKAFVYYGMGIGFLAGHDPFIGALRERAHWNGWHDR